MLLTSSPAVGIVSILDLGRADRCVVSHCFNLHFPSDMMRTSLHLLVICKSSLVRCLLRCLACFLTRLFVFSLLYLKSSLYVLDNSSLSDVFFTRIFSHHMAFLFILLSVLLGKHKSLILVKFSLSIIFFMDHAFSVVSKNPLP